MSLQSGPVINKGYYDVPICNQFSNVELRENPPRKTNEYQLNMDIRNTLNNNKLSYVITQDPTVPSPSLMYESDYPQSGYYYNKRDPMSIAFDGSVPPVSKELSKVYNYINSDNDPSVIYPKNIEKFINSMDDKMINKTKMKYVIIITSIIIIICIGCMASIYNSKDKSRNFNIYVSVSCLLFFNLLLFLYALLS